MTVRKVIVSLNPEEISRLTRIIIDEDKEDAFLYLKECIKPQVDQVTRSQRDPFLFKLRVS